MCEGSGKYTVDSITLAAGTSTTDADDLESVQDDLTYIVREAAATPGIDLIADFVDVEQFDYVNVLGYYDGSATHAVSIQLYCWESSSWHTWDALDGIEKAMTNHGIWIPCYANYIGTGANDGKVRVRFNHTMAGDVSHYLYLDVVSLYDRDTDLDALEVRIAQLEANEHKVINVYDETSTQTSTGGSSGTSVQGAGASGGVYPSRC